MRVGIRVPVGLPIPELAYFVARCEEAGFDEVGIHDHHHTGRDVYVAMAAAVMRTSKVAVYPVTSNTVTRDPVVLAALANSLDEMAPGRVLLSVAPGFLSVERAGREQASLDQVKETVRVVRALLNGEEVVIGGRGVRLTHTPERAPKILMVASGPRLLEAAGEVADGAVMLVGLHPAAVARARRHLQNGARRSKRPGDTLEEVFVVPYAVGSMEETAEWPRGYFRPQRPWLCYPSATKYLWLREAGLDIPRDLPPEQIDPATARRICDALGLFGPPEYCAERLLRAQQEAGVSHVFLFPEHTAETGYDLPRVEVEAFASVVGPALAAANGGR